MPPDACCTLTVADVILTGNSRSTSSEVLFELSVTVTANDTFQSYSRMSSGWLLPRTTRYVLPEDASEVSVSDGDWHAGPVIAARKKRRRTRNLDARNMASLLERCADCEPEHPRW